MPKQKTRKAAAKRFKRTGTGKFIHFRVGRRHILGKKSPKRKRHLRRTAVVKPSERRRLQSALPYGARD